MTVFAYIIVTYTAAHIADVGFTIAFITLFVITIVSKSELMLLKTCIISLIASLTYILTTVRIIAFIVFHSGKCIRFQTNITASIPLVF